MYKFTKNLATIGPVTDTEEMLEKLVEAGMNVARFNTKHSSPEWHQERIARVKNVAKRLNKPIGTLLDLQGPEIRINLIDEAPFEVAEGESVFYTCNENLDQKNKIIIPENVIGSVEVDNMILLDDGFCEFKVIAKGEDFLEAAALGKCTVKHRKTMNIPGITIDMPSLIEADYIQLDGIKENNVDFIGLSFVRDVADIEFLRAELVKRNITADICAKIETQAALDNLEEIVDASDCVMIARGDLGVEVPMEELIYWQKTIIDMCRAKGKPVITATQMLKSMVELPRPTRAEVSDVAHAIYDCTSAVMLSEETTIGEFPVKAVKTQADIAAFNEDKVTDNFRFEMGLEDDSDTAYIADAAMNLVDSSLDQIDAIICLTATGNTASLLASLRPECPIIAVTHNTQAYYRLSMAYAVEPVLLNKDQIGENNISSIVEALKDQKIIEVGQKVIMITGSVPFIADMTNGLSIITID